jgi:MFS family permease
VAELRKIVQTHFVCVKAFCNFASRPEPITLQLEDRQQLRHNFVVNVLDGTFFGLAIGVASFVTVIPLFVATLTDSTVLIGLIASIHMIGWQLPQLFTANRVAKLRRYKPMVLFMTMHERLPFLGLAVVAALVPVLGRELALILTFVMLIWQGLGGGVTATAWQAMVAKLMPNNMRGTFYGTQSAFANLLSSGGAVLAGVLLGSADAAGDFVACFLVAGVAMLISLVFLASTRESESETVPDAAQTHRDYWKALGRIVRRDRNFNWFVGARMLSQVAGVALSFYTIYAVRKFAMPAETVGVMTGVLMLSQTVANPLLGWLGDRWSHRVMFGAGALVAALAALVAIFAADGSWLYVVFALAGISAAALWTTAMALTAEFGNDANRPYYIGLSNTLVAPVTLAAPLLGGWLADAAGFETMFAAAAIAGVATAVLAVFGLREPGDAPIPEPTRSAVAATPSNL